MFCSRQNKEPSKITILNCIHHLSLFHLNCVNQQRKLTSVCWLYFSTWYILCKCMTVPRKNEHVACLNQLRQEPCSFCCTDYVWEKIHVCQTMTVWTTYHMEKRTTPTLAVQTITKHSFKQSHFNTLYTFFFQTGTAQVAAYNKSSFVSFGFC